MQRTAIVRTLFSGLALASAAVAIWFIGYADRPEMRYALLPCYYDKIFRHQGPIDVLVLGSSRTKQAVSAQTVADVLGSADKPLVVANLARSWRGNGQIYRMILDTQKNLGIRKAIVVELSSFNFPPNRTTLYYAGYYPNYEVSVPVEDFRLDLQSKPREPIYAVWRDFLNQFVVKFDKSLTVLLKGSTRETRKMARKAAQPTTNLTCFSKDNKRNEASLTKVSQDLVKQGKSWRDNNPETWDLADQNEDRPAFYIRKIKEFADANGIRFYLMLVPRYWDSLAAPAFLAEAETRFGVKVIEPTANFRDRMYVGGYTDPSHMGAKGRTEFSKWLGHDLKDRFEAKQDGAGGAAAAPALTEREVSTGSMDKN